MAVNLASAGFAFAAEWYWRIIGDDGGSFGAIGAIACLIPLAKLARGFVLDEIAASADDQRISFRLDGAPIAFDVELAPARAAADRFVIQLNRRLSSVGHAFALVVPTRYELRGVLLPTGALADHAQNRFVVAPTDRTSWRGFVRAATEL